MGNFAIWKIENQNPVRVLDGRIDLEKDLESWLEQDPSMLPGSIEILARQMRLESGVLDLLGMDPLGRWIVIEIKSGQVDQSTFTQALYYAAQIDKMPLEVLEEKVNSYLAKRGKTLAMIFQERGLLSEDQRESRQILLYLVGTRQSIGMQNLMNYINEHSQIDTSIVVFEVFTLDQGKQILVREVTDREEIPFESHAGSTAYRDAEEIFALSDQVGSGAGFRRVHEASLAQGLYARPYKKAIMYTSPRNRAKMIFTIWGNVNPLRIYIGHESFLEFYGIDSATITEKLGPEGWGELRSEDVEKFVNGLKSLDLSEG